MLRVTGRIKELIFLDDNNMKKVAKVVEIRAGTKGFAGNGGRALRSTK
jgi:hypothetical protein